MGCSVGSQCYIDKSGIDIENYKVPVILSDESKVLRFDFENGLYELILEHSDNSIDLSRADILPLLVQHNSEALPIGTFEDIRLEDKKLKATAIFDDEDAFAMKIFKKVSKGFMKSLSVGIMVNVKEPVKGKSNVFKATSWELQEASFVTIPAIANAKVGLKQENLSQKENKTMTIEKLKQDHGDLYQEIFNNGAKKEAQRIQDILSSIPEAYHDNEKLKAMVFDGKSDAMSVKATLFDMQESARATQEANHKKDGENLAAQVKEIDTNVDEGSVDTKKAQQKSASAALDKLNAKRGN
jgi:HK97 family phage prohead protease